MKRENINGPPRGWTHLGNGEHSPEGLYTKKPPIPEESEAIVIETPAGNFRIVAANSQQQKKT